MSDQKPNVFITGEELSRQREAEAVEQMRRNTEEQIKKRNEQIKKAAEQAEETEAKRAALMEEIARGREVQQQYTQQTLAAIQQVQAGAATQLPPIASQQPVTPQPNLSSSVIAELSKPQMHQQHDIIPLPSEGKLYSNKKARVKVAYMTTSDEDILTSPNLLESGDFLEILINRKLLEPDLRYRDLNMGDRNAIMLWLRATAYGYNYPITVYDSKNQPHDTDFDLSTLKTVPLGAEPDEFGQFSFTLPSSGSEVKFKFLTVGEIEDLQKLLEARKNSLVNKDSTIVLINQIQSIDGNSDKAFIRDFVDNMRIGDSKALKDYMAKIESGVDMTISVQVPGGETITTFLPLTSEFFWPQS